MIRWTITLSPKRPGPAPDGPPSPARAGLAEPTAVLFEEWVTTGLVRVDGTSILPDGAHLDVALYFDGERVAASIERTEIRHGAFRSRIRFPEGFRISSGTFQLRLSFGVQEEDPGDVERWRRERPELPWDETHAAVVIRDVFAGDPAEEREEAMRLEAYYREAHEAAGKLRKLLLTRSQEAKRLAQSWDPEILKRRAQAASAWFGDPMLDPEGRFDLSAWRRFLDEGFRPELLERLDRHQRREPGKYRTAERIVEEVWRRLLDLSRIESVMLYQSLGLGSHPNDHFLDSEGPLGDREILLQILTKELTVLDRYTRLSWAESAPKAR